MDAMVTLKLDASEFMEDLRALTAEINEARKPLTARVNELEARVAALEAPAIRESRPSPPPPPREGDLCRKR